MNTLRTEATSTVLKSGQTAGLASTASPQEKATALEPQHSYSISSEHTN